MSRSREAEKGELKPPRDMGQFPRDGDATVSEGLDMEDRRLSHMEKNGETS